MIIDCHGHYTTAPAALQVFRDAQLQATVVSMPAAPHISDDEIREGIEQHQLRMQRERGADVTLFSPRASAMGHHLGDASMSLAWTRVCNDLIRRVVELFPGNFVGVAQLPQSPEAPLDASVAELKRCVSSLGFVGCNVNPDPSG